MIKKTNLIIPFLDNIENSTLNNNYFRNVIYTSDNLQLVLMSLRPGKEIGREIHRKIDQFFRIESGIGHLFVEDKIYEISDGDAIVIPRGIYHNIKNIGNTPLKLYTLYSPPKHKQGLTIK